MLPLQCRLIAAEGFFIPPALTPLRTIAKRAAITAGRGVRFGPMDRIAVMGDDVARREMNPLLAGFVRAGRSR